MIAVEQLEQQVEQLDQKSFRAFHDWFQDFSWRRWDAQLAQDVQTGKLNALAAQALAHHAAGRTKRL